MMPHPPRRTAAALALSLALSLVPALAQARPFTSMPGAAPHSVEVRFADWVRSLLGFLLAPIGATAPAKNGSQLDPNGTPTENGPGLDPNGTPGENGPGLDPDGATAPGENGSQLDPDGRT
jgi:hypothetical protein